MNRFLLDTNVVSDMTRAKPSKSLTAWMAERRDGELFIATLTVAELRRGILEKPAGRKRQALEDWFDGVAGPLSVFAGRVLPFDERSAFAWARLMAEGTAIGRPRSALDMLVAAVAEANDCIVVTANEKHFEGVPFINPSRESAS